jgi:hypothetical protein
MAGAMRSHQSSQGTGVQSAAFRFLLSLRTPLNFLAAFFFAPGVLTAMNSPDVLFRFVQAVAPPSFVFDSGMTAEMVERV